MFNKNAKAAEGNPAAPAHLSPMLKGDRNLDVSFVVVVVVVVVVGLCASNARSKGWYAIVRDEPVTGSYSRFCAANILFLCRQHVRWCVWAMIRVGHVVKLFA